MGNDLESLDGVMCDTDGSSILDQCVGNNGNGVVVINTMEQNMNGQQMDDVNDVNNVNDEETVTTKGGNINRSNRRVKCNTNRLKKKRNGTELL